MLYFPRAGILLCHYYQSEDREEVVTSAGAHIV
jgi:hypothetical protein